jgi:cyclic pyranopterin phosphate synthase
MVLRMTKLTHLDETGAARMVDVGEKPASERIARAGAVIRMQAATLELLAAGGHRKGDVLAVARVAGIQAAKRCWELIPLCHPLMLTAVSVDFTVDQPASCLRVEAVCKVRERTGVEMEALTAASVAALTVYDMCKAVDRGMRIDELRLLEKAGGRSGAWRADESGAP